MFERFTDRARRVIVVAQEEAQKLNNDFIKPEHLLLGLAQGDGVAAKALGQLGVSLETLRAKVEQTLERSKTDRRGSKIPFSPKAKRALELSLREALRLGHNYIGTEHLMLGTLRVVDDDDGAVSRLLGVEADDVRSRVIGLIENHRGGVDDLSRSAAARDAMRLARQLAGAGPMTTGHVVLAVLSDADSQASRALGALGVTADSLQALLAQVSLEETSDAPPRPQTIEIKLGDTTTAIGDPDLAAALGELSPEQLRAALRDVLGVDTKRPKPRPRKAG
ncbi:MAG: Clp protease N-terminal domain-containing protein [Acidimicrobiales bacterium]|jgi:ATP-dependent Clp protease ATP-binding subunit ClpC